MMMASIPKASQLLSTAPRLPGFSTLSRRIIPELGFGVKCSNDFVFPDKLQ